MALFVVNSNISCVRMCRPNRTCISISYTFVRFVNLYPSLMRTPDHPILLFAESSLPYV